MAGCSQGVDVAAKGVDALLGQQARGAVCHGGEDGLGAFECAFGQQQLDQVVAGFVVAGVLGQRVFQLGQRGFRVAGFGQLLGFQGFQFRDDFTFAGHVLVQELADFLGGQGAHEAVHRLAAHEHHAKRDGAHAKHLRELAGDFLLFVGVDLGQQETAGVLGFELFQYRAQRLAGAAPLGPDVQQHGLLQGGLDQVGLKVGKGDVDHGGQIFPR